MWLELVSPSLVLLLSRLSNKANFQRTLTGISSEIVFHCLPQSVLCGSAVTTNPKLGAGNRVAGLSRAESRTSAARLRSRRCQFDSYFDPRATFDFDRAVFRMVRPDQA